MTLRSAAFQHLAKRSEDVQEVAYPDTLEQGNHAANAHRFQVTGALGEFAQASLLIDPAHTRGQPGISQPDEEAVVAPVTELLIPDDIETAEPLETPAHPANHTGIPINGSLKVVG